MGAQGTATIDFTSTPSEECVLLVVGQAAIIAGSHVEAFFMHGDSTADNTAEEHAMAAMGCPLSCQVVTPGDSFEIRAMPFIGMGIGTFKVRWVWN